MVRSSDMDLSALLVLSFRLYLSESAGSLLCYGSLQPDGSLLISGSLGVPGSLVTDGSLNACGLLSYPGSLPIRLDLVDMLLVCKLKHIRHWCRLAKLNLMPNLVQMR